MKKSSNILAIILSLLFVLTVLCSLYEKRSVAEKTQPIVVEYWTHEDSARDALENDLIASFMADNPGIVVHRTTHGSSDQIDLVPRAFAAGGGPDLFNLPIENAYPLISRGFVAPVDVLSAGYASSAELENTYLPGVLDAVTEDDAIYGLPLEYTNWCLYVNKDAFARIGLNAETDYPRTWEEMVSLSQKLVVRDGEVLKERGFDFRYPFYLNFLVPMAEQLGGKLVSDDGKTALVGEEAWVKVLDFMQQWGPDGLNLGSPTYTNSRYAFAGDDATTAMALSGLYQERRMSKQYPAFFDSKRWMVVPFPLFENAVRDVSSCTYAHYFMVNASSSDAVQQASWKLAGYLLSHGEEYLKKTSLLQPTKELLQSETLKKMPYSEVFVGDLKRSHVVYHGSRSSEIQDLLSQAVESVMLGGVSPSKAYVTLKSGVQELLDEGRGTEEKKV